MRIFKVRTIAEWTGLTRQGVHSAFKKAPYSSAVCGHRIDIDHPEAARWLHERGVDASSIDPITSQPKDDNLVAAHLSKRNHVPVPRFVRACASELRTQALAGATVDQMRFVLSGYFSWHLDQVLRQAQQVLVLSPPGNVSAELPSPDPTEKSGPH